MKYSNYIRINDAFQYSINLQFDINNINKIKEYIPTTDSCEVMEYYFDSILGNFSKATTLIGPYGKGKSHLLLIILTLLNDYREEDIGILEMLIEKIKAINSDLYKKIKKIRENKNKYLPVIINSNYNNMNQAFLLALSEALEREKIKNINVNTYFKAALDVIKQWEDNNDKEILQKFEVCLKSNNTNLEDLKYKLSIFDDKGYKEFKSVYKCVMHGIEFNPLINTDIVKYYKDVNYKINQIGYNGMLIIFDEFSKFLEYVGNEDMMKDLKIIQDFAELASRTGKREQIIFTCITHKTINEYIKNLKEDKVNAFKTVEGRFKDIYFNRSMEQNYEIISQTIMKLDDFEKYIDIEMNKRNSFYLDIENQFRFCRFENVKEILFKGCYPLNPVTVFAVINLSEKVAQNERTLFTFLTDDDINSFKYFVNNNQDEELFNVNKVYDYFYNILRKENDNNIKEIWIKTENAINKVSDKKGIEIIKSLGIIYMINDFDNLPPNEESLRLSVDMEKNQFELKLKELVNLGIIKKKKSNKMFDFCTVYNKEVVKEIEKFMNTKFNKINVRNTLEKIIDLGYIIPREYNQRFKMTRFFKTKFITEEEILNIRTFKIIKQENFADGLILNLLRTSTDIGSIENKVKEIADKSIIVKVPKDIISEELLNALKEYESIEYIKRTENNEEEIEKELNLIEDDIVELIQNEIKNKFENVECLLYLNEIVVDNNLSGLCSRICKNIYNETPVINNEMINKKELSNPIIKARNIVIECILNNNKDMIKTNTSAEATIYKAIVEKKDKEDVRKIINIIKKYIKDTEKTDKRSFEKLILKLTSQPYGIRNGIIPILIAISFEEYSENIILYYQNREVEMNSTNISKIVDEPEKFFLYVEAGTQDKIKFVKEMAQLFNSKYSNIERNNIKELVYKMKNWALGLPRVSRELEIENKILNNKGFIAIKNKLLTDDLNNNEFLFKTLRNELDVYDFRECFKQMDLMKKSFDHYTENLIYNMLIKLKERFEHNSKNNLNRILTEWYKRLNNRIKETVISYEAKKIFEYIEELDTFNESEIFENFSYILLGYYVEDWQNNTEIEFFDKLDNLLAEINDARKINVTKQEKVTISTENSDITKYINSNEITAIGNTLKNNIEDSIDEYGDSISESEKIKILLEIIKKYM